MLQTMYEMDNDLDVLGRPDDWERVNKKLDANLPYIRELANIGKGVWCHIILPGMQFFVLIIYLLFFQFISSGRLRAIAVDGDIFVSRLDDLQEIRDRLVQRVKSFVNGKLGKLARANHGYVSNWVDPKQNNSEKVFSSSIFVSEKTQFSYYAIFTRTSHPSVNLPSIRLNWTQRQLKIS